MTATIEDIALELKSPPACLAPWIENPYRLVSRLDMLKFNAHHWIAATSTIGQAIANLNYATPSGQTIQAIAECCGMLHRDCEALGLKLVVAQLIRFRDQVIRPGVTYAEIRAALIDINQRLFDEMEARSFFSISDESALYFGGQHFPASITERFPQVSFDADEAGKCLALERPTAAVYHLMRVTEYGLQQIGKKLGIKDERPNWEPIINKIDAELRKPYKEREFKGMAEFLASVSAHVNAVKVAWRNRVMHVDRKHTVEDAREIYNATSGLMRYIAENLPKDTGAVAKLRAII